MIEISSCNACLMPLSDMKLPSHFGNQSSNTFNPLSTNSTKWSNTHGKLPKNCLSVFDHFGGLALKALLCSCMGRHFKNNYQCKYSVPSFINACVSPIEKSFILKMLLL